MVKNCEKCIKIRPGTTNNIAFAQNRVCKKEIQIEMIMCANKSVLVLKKSNLVQIASF